MKVTTLTIFLLFAFSCSLFSQTKKKKNTSKDKETYLFYEMGIVYPHLEFTNSSGVESLNSEAANIASQRFAIGKGGSIVKQLGYLLTLSNSRYDIRTHYNTASNIYNVHYLFDYAALDANLTYQLIGGATNPWSFLLRAGPSYNYLISGFQEKQAYEVIDLNNDENFAKKHIDLNFGAFLKCQLNKYTSTFLGYNYKYGLPENERETAQDYNINAHMINVGFSYAIAGLKQKHKENDYQKQIKRLKAQISAKQDADEANQNCLEHLKNTDDAEDFASIQDIKDYFEQMGQKNENACSNCMFNSLVVLFPSNSSNYYPASQIDLNNLLNFLKSKKYRQINITGYADMSGNKDENLSLSKNRANKVSEFMINNGVDPKVIKTEYWGGTNQFDSSNLVNNRRVEINIEY